MQHHLTRDALGNLIDWAKNNLLLKVHFLAAGCCQIDIVLMNVVAQSSRLLQDHRPSFCHVSCDVAGSLRCKKFGCITGIQSGNMW